MTRACDKLLGTRQLVGFKSQQIRRTNIYRVDQHRSRNQCRRAAPTVGWSEPGHFGISPKVGRCGAQPITGECGGGDAGGSWRQRGRMKVKMTALVDDDDIFNDYSASPSSPFPLFHFTCGCVFASFSPNIVFNLKMFGFYPTRALSIANSSPSKTLIVYCSFLSQSVRLSSFLPPHPPHRALTYYFIVHST